MFSNTNLNQTYQHSFSAGNLAFSNLSPSSSSNELCMSPYLCSPNSFNDTAEQQMSSNVNIQFSPSIKNENSSDDESMDEQNDSDEQKNDDEKSQEISGSKLGMRVSFYLIVTIRFKSTI